MNGPARAYDYEINLASVIARIQGAWLFILCCAVVGAIAGAIAAFTMRPAYVAVATIAPVTDSQQSGASALVSQFGGLASLAGIEVPSLSQGRAQHSVPYLQSRILAEEFVKERGLPQVLAGQEASGKALTVWRATQIFTRRVLQVDVDRRTNLISVSIEWSDPVVAAEWANGFVMLANERLRNRDHQRADGNIQFLNEQLSNTKIIGLQQVLLKLLESEMRSVMLANADAEYAFSVIDPATSPETPAKPKRTLLVVGGALGGGLLSLLAVPFVLRPDGQRRSFLRRK